MGYYLMCNTHAPEYCDGALYALVHVDRQFILMLAGATAAFEAAAAVAPAYSLCNVTLWEGFTRYLGYLPDALEDALEEWWGDWGPGEWCKLPFTCAEVRAFLSSEKGAFFTSMDARLLSVAPRNKMYFAATVKHTDFTVETPCLPAFSDLERLALMGASDEQ